jgi:carbamoyltransferase
MKILGISGLDQSVLFRRRQWPGLDEREYRISQGHDAAAALVLDGKCLYAAAEERFSRKKHSGEFPAAAIDFCLTEAGLGIDDIDEIAHGFDYSPYKSIFLLDPISARLYNTVYSREAFVAAVQRHFPHFPSERIVQVNHHLAHAASAYYTSGWNECLVIVLDGMGEVDSVSVYLARDGRLERIHRIPATDSIGILYSLITLHLGFDFNADEYKIMGLAPYGDPARFREFFNRIVTLGDNGSIRIPILHMQSNGNENTYQATRGLLAGSLIRERQPDEEITDDHRDVAAALQEVLENTLLYICGYFASRTGVRKLALAGGVALNCTANGKLLQSGHFDEVYIQPAAGDDGSALGAALHRSAQAGCIVNERQKAPFLGPAYRNGNVASALRHQADRIDAVTFSTLDETCAEAARLIQAGSVIAWYRGRMEFGPRALGHRSILADPGRPEMRDRINAMVKMREAFRPFAPAVAIEEVHRWFDVPPGTELPYMITIVDVREPYRAELPAITHVNGSARVQTVSAKDNGDFHALLEAVGRFTGRRMVLNTSFNVKGQPIVNTPGEAIETYLRTGIDYLFIENTLVARKSTLADSRASVLTA